MFLFTILALFYEYKTLILRYIQKRLLNIDNMYNLSPSHFSGCYHKSNTSEIECKSSKKITFTDLMNIKFNRISTLQPSCIPFPLPLQQKKKTLCSEAHR